MLLFIQKIVEPYISFAKDFVSSLDNSFIKDEENAILTFESFDKPDITIESVLFDEAVKQYIDLVYKSDQFLCLKRDTFFAALPLKNGRTLSKSYNTELKAWEINFAYIDYHQLDADKSGALIIEDSGEVSYLINLDEEEQQHYLSIAQDFLKSDYNYFKFDIEFFNSSFAEIENNSLKFKMTTEEINKHRFDQLTTILGQIDPNTFDSESE